MGRMGRRVGSLVGGLLVLVAVAGVVVGVVFVVGMRSKSPGVQRAVRRMNKTFWNPRAMETAGTPGAYASVIHHVGRRSGTAYETPIVPVETDDGFAIALPYGLAADWVQNVLVAGRATITREGQTIEVDHPEVVPTGNLDVHFGDSERTAHRALRVDDCLHLHRVETLEA